MRRNLALEPALERMGQDQKISVRSIFFDSGQQSGRSATHTHRIFGNLVTRVGQGSMRDCEDRVAMAHGSPTQPQLGQNGRNVCLD